LQRGYSITRTIPDRSVVRNANKVAIDQQLEILLGRGKLAVSVVDKTNEIE
jgi:exodeoxyribonuclease VII large subunit